MTLQVSSKDSLMIPDLIEKLGEAGKKRVERFYSWDKKGNLFTISTRKCLAMKVLLVHNFYISTSPSGEDSVFRAECELLQKHGIKVVTYEKHNDDIVRLSKRERLGIPSQLIWSRKTYGELERLIEAENPDIAHFHNIFYLISPSAYYACKKHGIPVVQTLHNFRMFCVNGLLMRDGRVCEECIGKLPWRGIIHGCYRGSRLYSIAVSLMECFHRFVGTWRDKVDAYIALTEFGKKKFIEAGLPEEKIFVKPNFLQHPPEPYYSNDGYAIFLGRLSEEKGVNILVDACRVLQSTIHDHFFIKAIGDGPLKKSLKIKSRDEKIQNIEFTGRKSFKECMELMKGARFMVMPSIWYETFGLTGAEAFACGKPVIASRLGAMAEMVEDGKTGLLFETGSAEDLASKMKWMLENEDACIEMGKNARAEFEAKYTADKNYKILMNIYQTVLERR